MTKPTIQNKRDVQHQTKHKSYNMTRQQITSGDHIPKTQQKIENINGNPWQLKYTTHATNTDKLQHNTYSKRLRQSL